jgi:biopolymer transport protein ExbD
MIAAPMKFYTRHKPRPQVPIVPLIDILTILLIFFIVTTTFKKKDADGGDGDGAKKNNEALLSITLPAASDLKVTLNPGERLTIGLTEAGEVFLGDAPVELDELAPILQGLKLEEPNAKLELRVDKNVPVGLLVEVWNTLTKAGIEVKDVPSRILVGPEPDADVDVDSAEPGVDEQSR